MVEKNFNRIILILLLMVFFAIGVNLFTGYISLHIEDFFQSNTEHAQIASLRINRVWAMVLVGLAIPTSGFLLQEYFQNPLAGPSVLGITSVASLSAAFYLFFFQNLNVPDWLQNSFISISAIIGSFLLLLLLLFFSNQFKDKSYLIIFGFLISAMSGAIVSILQLYAENQSLKNYILWSFGANNQASKNQLIVLTVLIIIGLILSFKSIKPLIGNLLGEQYAKSFGVSLSTLKLLIILASSLLSASVTAFLGPILFIGIVVPHFSRMIYAASHLWQQWILNMLLGILIMEIFSIISEISQFPINVITSLVGVPIILTMLLKKTYA